MGARVDLRSLSHAQRGARLVELFRQESRVYGPNLLRKDREGGMEQVKKGEPPGPL